MRLAPHEHPLVLEVARRPTRNNGTSTKYGYKHSGALGDNAMDDFSSEVADG